MVSEEALHAVLVEQTEEGARVQARFSQVRGSNYESTSDFGLPADEGSASDYGDEQAGDDFTIQFGGEAGGGNNMFLGSEFGDLGDTSEGGEGAMSTGPSSFQFGLEEILAQCDARGYEDPEVVFCVAASEVDELELRLPPDDKGTEEQGRLGLPLPAKRSKLLNLLEEQYEGAVSKERVAFLPLIPAEDGRRRVLALIGKPNGSVVSTLRAMRDQKSARLPLVRRLDSEVPLYVGLARAALQLPPGAEEKTLVVRAGRSDTLALFMSGNTLQQAESLRSLTARDPAETICSRVLLLQDEYGIGDVDHVLLIGEDGEEDLVEGFEMFFPEAEVGALRQYLPQREDDEPVGPYVAATGIALHHLEAADFEGVFHDFNLLTKALMKHRFRLPVSWSVPALFLLLFFTALGFVWFYLSNAHQIEQQRQRLRRYKSQVANMDERALQARIDSMKALTDTYVEGLQVLDTLLQGSNKWSKALADVSRQTASVEGVWVDTWQPQQSTQFQVAGNATSRDRIVSLAERLDGTIHSVSFSEIRDWPVYSFEMSVPLETDIPEAARYLRKKMAAAGDGDSATSESTPASTVALEENN